VRNRRKEEAEEGRKERGKERKRIDPNLHLKRGK